MGIAKKTLWLLSITIVQIYCVPFYGEDGSKIVGAEAFEGGATEGALQDSAVVDSKIREVRAAPSNPKKRAYVFTYGDGEGESQGYHKKTQEQGDDGYEHHDSYHKKDGDKYGYEKHFSYGKGKKGAAEGGEKSGEYYEKEEADGGETKNTYNVVEDFEG